MNSWNKFRFLILVLIIMLSAQSALGQELPKTPEELISALQTGGYVIYIRHAATDRTETDTDLATCETQRNLNDKGRAEAEMIGSAFAQLQIPLGQVWVTVYCRTRDTAQIAFGRWETFETIFDDGALATMLSTAPEAGTNTVIVAHGQVLLDTTNILIDEGDSAVFAPLGDGQFAFVVRVSPAQWGQLAELNNTLPSMQEFTVPTGTHPHDVAPAPDGTVWYTAQQTGGLGRLDPTTGEYHEIPLGAGSSPHGVIVGPDGAAWVTDSGLNAIVRVDAATEEVDIFPLPSSNANLNTASFDGNGILWFTGQNGIYGRLDPAAGEITVFDAPRGRGPYGITTTPSGDIYYASLAGSYVGRINIETGEVTVLEPPTPGQGARRVWSDSLGRIWVSEWNAGNVAVYDPADDTWQEWRLPGTNPRPYAVYVDDLDMVWLSDFGANALVRFNPQDETFEVFPLQSRDAAVRQILGRPGEIWGAESSVDKIVVLRTGQ